MSDKVTLPESWQNWKIGKLLGTGSFGRVYQASAAGPDGGVLQSAIKIIRIPADEKELHQSAQEYPNLQDLTNSFADRVRKLCREIQVMERLRGNPNIVELQDTCIEHEEGSMKWEIFLRMELLTPFKEYKAVHEFPQEAVIRLGIDICNALETCSKQHIIHRDIKPENILVTEEGTCKLGDFGVVKQLQNTNATMSRQGTFMYMAPEVYHAESYDERADQYSLGIMLYKLLNNNRDPFMDPDAQMIGEHDCTRALMKRMEGEALEPPKHASQSLSRVVRKACAYRPENRYGSPAALKKDLEKCLAGQDVAVSDLMELSEEEQKALRQKKEKRRRVLSTVFAAGAVLAAVLITTAVLSKKTENEVILEESNEIEAQIRESGVQIDENASAFAGYEAAARYQDEINDTAAHPETKQALEQVQTYRELAEQDKDLSALYEHETAFAAYLDEEYCAVETVYYEVVIDETTKRERVDHQTGWYYLSYNALGEWQICPETDEQDIEEIQNRMNAVYLPEGYIQAAQAGRNTYLDAQRMAYWTGEDAVFSDENDSSNMELAAIWQNADGSADAYFICRNASKYETCFSSYWLQLQDSELGNILLAYGHLKLFADPGESDGFLLHFDSSDVLTGSETWSDCSNYFTGMNTNENI